MSVTELEEYRATTERTALPLSHYAVVPEAPRRLSGESFSYRFWTSSLDIAGATFGLAVALPILGAVAVAVKLTSKGPAIFNQLRVGRDGQLFRCYKFRTMIVDAEAFLDQNPELKAEFQKRHKLDSDPRVTKIGSFLRKTSLDELPQFVNVLLGDMSLVGPRPIVPAELSKYGEYADQLVQVKPGLTGLWQVSGRSETTYEERVDLDMKYIATRSVLGDLAIIFKTARVLLERKGAC